MHKRFRRYIDSLIMSSKPKRVKSGAGEMSISHDGLNEIRERQGGVDASPRSWCEHMKAAWPDSFKTACFLIADMSGQMRHASDG
ncbi:hypothetical protein [Noviherbaspirillum malthae]|uniref:hypothetical protein n=1 Tax=Noviherbaspirillum malthae TaxID=1260987 RepID=UPI00188FBF17|nr:hypothetical protein [Noviherbaspirillum malthae]